MITSIKITGGFAKDLPALKRKIKLRPGVNVLVGENGSGKTTLIRLLAAYSSCPDTGWSRWPTPHDLRGFGTDRPYPNKFDELSLAGGCTANVRWDGTASYYSETFKEDAPVHDFREGGSSYNTIEKAFLMRQASSGQLRLAVLSKVFEAVRDQLPDLGACSKAAKHMNDVWQGYAKKFEDYVNTMKPTGVPSVLMDEPDRGLSLVNQARFWARISEVPITRVQLVISTHSVFAMGAANANIIELTPGFIAAFTEGLSAAADGWRAITKRKNSKKGGR